MIEFQLNGKRIYSNILRADTERSISKWSKKKLWITHHQWNVRPF